MLRTCAVLFVLLSPISAQTIPALLTFEDRPVGTPVFNQYSGVTFPGGDVSRVTLVQPPLGTISGIAALQFLRVDCDVCGSQLQAQFSVGQHRVKLSTGLVRNFSSGNLAAIMRGYSDQSRTVLVAQSPPLLLGSTPTTIDNPLEIDSSTGAIRLMTLTVVLFGNQDVSPDGVPVVVDNLEYDAPVAAPPLDTTSPVIRMIRPLNGQSIQGVTPGLLSTRLEAAIDELALRSVSISLNSRPARLIQYAQVSPGEYSVGEDLLDSDGLVTGANLLTLTASDFAGNAASVTTQFQFTPRSVPTPSAVDIIGIAVEATQSISTSLAYLAPPGEGARFTVFPIDSAAPRLIQGKETLIRVYAAALGATGRVTNVPATARVLRDNCRVDCGLNDYNPLPPMNSRHVPNLSGISLAPAGTPGADPQNERRDLAASWNFMLPGQWTSENLVIYVDMNDGNFNPLPNTPSVPECVSPFVGQCGDNNEIEIHLAFAPSQSVTYDPVLVELRGNLGGSFVDVIPDVAQAAATLNKLNEVYPMQVGLGVVRTYTDDPNNDKGGLLDDLQDTFGCGDWWAACGYDPTHFIDGLIPDDQQPPGQTFAALRDSGGYSNRGNGTFWTRVTAPVDSSAHEMGHAIGFMHASCDHDEASGGACDAFFPIAHGGIGGVGFDFDAWAIVLPGNANSHSHDFMSYGDDPQWVSTYTWDVTLTHSRVDTMHYFPCTPGIGGPFGRCGVIPASGRAIALNPNTVATGAGVGRAAMVSGHIDFRGYAQLRPIFVVEDFPVSPSSKSDPGEPYTLEFLDAKGNTITLRDFVPREAGHHSPTYLFNELVPLPEGKPISRVNLLRQGRVIASIARKPAPLRTPKIVAPTKLEAWKSNDVRRVRWQAESPEPLSAIVEYAADGSTFVPLARYVKSNFFDVKVNELASGSNARIRVRVSDGINTAVVVSDPFVVGASPPQALILQPNSGVVVVRNVPLELIGAGSDLDQELPETAFIWTSNLSGPVGVGRMVVTSALRPGRHHLTLTVTNAKGLSRQVATEITIHDYGKPGTK